MPGLGGGQVCSGGVPGLGVCVLVSQHALGQTPYPPGEMATAADGMHPTGMHSCFDIFYFARRFLSSLLTTQIL